MNSRSADWSVAVVTYAPTGAFWWTICSVMFIYGIDHNIRSIVKLVACTLSLGVISSLMIMVLLTKSV